MLLSCVFYLLLAQKCDLNSYYEFCSLTTSGRLTFYGVIIFLPKREVPHEVFGSGRWVFTIFCPAFREGADASNCLAWVWSSSGMSCVGLSKKLETRSFVGNASASSLVLFK